LPKPGLSIDVQPRSAHSAACTSGDEGDRGVVVVDLVERTSGMDPAVRGRVAIGDGLPAVPAADGADVGDQVSIVELHAVTSYCDGVDSSD